MIDFRKILILSIFSLSFAVYQVGDQISQTDQSRQFNVCYGAEYHDIESDNGNFRLSLADYNGQENGGNLGDYNVIMINMAASW